MYLVEEHVSSLQGFVNNLGKCRIVLFLFGTPFIFIKEKKRKKTKIKPCYIWKAKFGLPGSNTNILSIEISPRLEEDSFLGAMKGYLLSSLLLSVLHCRTI